MDEDFLKEYIEKRRLAGTFRELPSSGDGVDFLSNDYLGLSRNEELRQLVEQQWSLDNRQHLGGTGSRLLSGNHPLYQVLEAQLTELFQSEAVLVFNSGYQANQALLSSIAGKDDILLYDELAHVCLKEGAWLSRARTFSFRHNDVADLRRRLQKLSRPGKRIFVVTETLFSMDGDFAPIDELLVVCEEFGAHPIIDEAHSTGVYGASGAGWLIDQGLHHRVFGRVYTFGKAMGSHGACVAGSRLLIDYLINAARPFIYTTSLPPHTLRTLIESFRYLSGRPQLAQQLSGNIDYFRSKYRALFQESSRSFSAIQPIHISGAEKCLEIASALRDGGNEIMAIRAPTVREGQERIRICLHTHNTEAEIDHVLSLLFDQLKPDATPSI